MYPPSVEMHILESADSLAEKFVVVEMIVIVPFPPSLA